MNDSNKCNTNGNDKREKLYCEWNNRLKGLSQINYNKNKRKEESVCVHV